MTIALLFTVAGRTVVATVVEEFLHVEVNNVRADVIEETLIVRHNEQRLLPVLQVTVHAHTYARFVYGLTNDKHS